MASCCVPNCCDGCGKPSSFLIGRERAMLCGACLVLPVKAAA